MRFFDLVGLTAMGVCAAALAPSRTSATSAAAWVDLGSTPGAANGHRPQGMTLVGDAVVFTEHRHDTATTLVLLDRATFAVRARAEMPPEATHTGGLAWDGEALWAVDYNAHTLYALDLARTFATGHAVVLSSRATGLLGTSALAVVRVDGRAFLAISDFGAPGLAQTCLLAVERASALAHGSLVSAADVCYANGGFSQGLAADDSYLYEALNAVGRDRIRVIDVRAALRSGDSARVIEIAVLDAPGDAIEDLETDGETLWTSDEESFHFFALSQLPAAIAAAGAR